MSTKVARLPKKPKASGRRLKGFTANAVAKIQAKRTKAKDQAIIQLARPISR